MRPDELKKLLRDPPSPKADPRRQRLARQAALEAFRLGAAGNRREIRPWSLAPFAAGLAAGLLLAAVLWLLRPGTAPDVAAGEPWEDELRILAEMERLFPGQLQAIILGRKSDSLLLSAEPVFQEQPVFISFRRGEESVRILTFNGNRLTATVGGEEIVLDILITGDGGVILAGEDFVWTNRRPQRVAGFDVEVYAGGKS